MKTDFLIEKKAAEKVTSPSCALLLFHFNSTNRLKLEKSFLDLTVNVGFTWTRSGNFSCKNKWLFMVLFGIIISSLIIFWIVYNIKYSDGSCKMENIISIFDKGIQSTWVENWTFNNLELRGIYNSAQVGQSASWGWIQDGNLVTIGNESFT